MSANEESMRDQSNSFSDDDYEEDWICILNTKGRYELSKAQGRLVQQAMANGERGTIMFETFAIPLAYVAEFYRAKRYLKANKVLSAGQQETVYKPMDPEKWQKMKEDLYRKLGKRVPTTKPVENQPKPKP